MPRSTSTRAERDQVARCVDAVASRRRGRIRHRRSDARRPQCRSAPQPIVPVSHPPAPFVADGGRTAVPAAGRSSGSQPFASTAGARRAAGAVVRVDAPARA